MCFWLFDCLIFSVSMSAHFLSPCLSLFAFVFPFLYIQNQLHPWSLHIHLIIVFEDLLQNQHHFKTYQFLE